MKSVQNPILGLKLEGDLRKCLLSNRNLLMGYQVVSLSMWLMFYGKLNKMHTCTKCRFIFHHHMFQMNHKSLTLVGNLLGSYLFLSWLPYSRNLFEEIFPFFSCVCLGGSVLGFQARWDGMCTWVLKSVTFRVVVHQMLHLVHAWCKELLSNKALQNLIAHLKHVLVQTFDPIVFFFFSSFEPKNWFNVGVFSVAVATLFLSHSAWPDDCSYWAGFYF